MSLYNLEVVIVFFLLANEFWNSSYFVISLFIIIFVLSKLSLKFFRNSFFWYNEFVINHIDKYAIEIENLHKSYKDSSLTVADV